MVLLGACYAPGIGTKLMHVDRRASLAPAEKNYNFVHFHSNHSQTRQALTFKYPPKQVRSPRIHHALWTAAARRRFHNAVSVLFRIATRFEKRWQAIALQTRPTNIMPSMMNTIHATNQSNRTCPPREMAFALCQIVSIGSNCSIASVFFRKSQSNVRNSAMCLAKTGWDDNFDEKANLFRDQSNMMLL